MKYLPAAFLYLSVLILLPMWRNYPNVLTCNLFFLAFTFSQILYGVILDPGKIKLYRSFICVGGILNWLVITENGGYMPVFSDNTHKFSSVWKEAGCDTRMFFLSDCLWDGFSIGDVVIIASGILFIASLTDKNMRKVLFEGPK